MSASVVLKEKKFKLVSEFIKKDSKKRLSLGNLSGTAFNVYVNSFGQVILDPVEVVPQSEVWLYRNPSALRSVKKGLAEVNRDKIHDLGSFQKYL